MPHARDRVPEAFAPYLDGAIAHVNVPAYIVDRDGRIRWLNAAARKIVGDVVGEPFTAVVQMEDTLARSIFAGNLATPGPHDRTVALLRPNRTTERVELSAVPLGDTHHAVGMFGLAVPRTRQARARAGPQEALTPRQHDVLDLLADGASTDAIAAQLVLSPQTVRNHIRHVLKRLGARTRLEAVANARRAGLV